MTRRSIVPAGTNGILRLRLPRWTLPEPARCTILDFGAVDYHAQVWVNGEFVAEHEGGHTPFSADISYALRPGTLQRVTVRVMDAPFDLEKPRGKQDWRLKPHAIWYARTTGIWQTVWLEGSQPPMSPRCVGRRTWSAGKSHCMPRRPDPLPMSCA